MRVDMRAQWALLGLLALWRHVSVHVKQEELWQRRRESTTSCSLALLLWPVLAIVVCLYYVRRARLVCRRKSDSPCARVVPADIGAVAAVCSALVMAAERGTCPP